MITNTITVTTPMNPAMASGFGMPMRGHAVFATAVSGQWCADFPDTEIARDRAVIKGQVAHVAYVPGSNAWSPPLC